MGALPSDCGGSVPMGSSGDRRVLAALEPFSSADTGVRLQSELRCVIARAEAA